MKKIAVILIASFTILACHAQHQVKDTGSSENLIFPKDAKITNNNFTGNAWLEQIITPDSLNPTQVGNVTFESGARTNWHYHPGGQVLLNGCITLYNTRPEMGQGTFQFYSCLDCGRA